VGIKEWIRNLSGRRTKRKAVGVFLGVERLEDRLLPSAADPFLTVVVHGQDWGNDQDPPAWTNDLADSIKARFDATSSDQVLAYGWATLGPLNTVWTERVRLANTIRLQVDNMYVSNGNRPIDVHLIAHSRGAVLISEATKILDSSEEVRRKVDRFEITTLDPHPDYLNYHDPAPMWSGIIDYWESYYQHASYASQEGFTFLQGIALKTYLPRVVEYDLTSVVAAWPARITNTGNHEEVHDWYHWAVNKESFGHLRDRPVIPPPRFVDPTVISFVEDTDPGLPVAGPRKAGLPELPTNQQVQPQVPPSGVRDDYSQTLGPTSNHIPLDSSGSGKLTGNIEWREDRDYFQFIARKNDNLVVSASPLNGSLDPFLRLYDVFGNPVAPPDGNGGGGKTARIAISNAVAGRTYLVEVSGSGISTGSYRIDIDQSNPMAQDPAGLQPNTLQLADDHPDSESTAGSILLSSAGGATVSGRLEASGDDDWFTFIVRQSGQLLVEVETPNSSLDTFLRLHNAGVLVAQGRNRIVRTVNAGEQYWLHVRANDPVQTGLDAMGRYVVNISQPAVADLPGNNGTDSPPGPLPGWGGVRGVTINLDGNGSGNSSWTIDSPGDVRWFQIDGAQTPYMQITVTGDNDLVPYLVAFNDQGGPIDSDSGDNSSERKAQIAIPVTNGQRIILAVASNQSSSTGSFRAQVRRSDSATVPASSSIPLTPEGNGFKESRISQSGQEWSDDIPVRTTGWITLEVDTADSTLIPFLRHTYHGGDTDDPGADGRTRMSFYATAGDTVHIVVSGSNGSVGSFTLIVQQGLVNPNDDHPDVSGIAVPGQSLGQDGILTISGRIDYAPDPGNDKPGDKDSFRILATHPGPVAIQVASLTPGFVPFLHAAWKISDSVTGQDTDGGSGRGGRSFMMIPDILSEPDNWINLDITGSGMFPTGSYVVTVWQPQSANDIDPDAVGEAASPLGVNQVVSASIDVAGDRDVFQVEATAPGPLTIRALPPAGGNDGITPYLVIYDANRQAIMSGGDKAFLPDGREIPGAGQIILDAERGQRFYVEVKAADPADTGPYFLEALQTIDDHAQVPANTVRLLRPLPDGVAQAGGTISTVGDRDVFQVLSPQRGQMEVEVQTTPSALTTWEGETMGVGSVVQGLVNQNTVTVDGREIFARGMVPEGNGAVTLTADGGAKGLASRYQDLNIATAKLAGDITNGVELDFATTQGSSYNFTQLTLTDGTEFIRLQFRRVTNGPVVLWLGGSFQELANLAPGDNTTFAVQENAALHLAILNENGEIHVYLADQLVARFQGSLAPSFRLEALAWSPMAPDRFAELKIFNVVGRPWHNTGAIGAAAVSHVGGILSVQADGSLAGGADPDNNAAAADLQVPITQSVGFEVAGFIGGSSNRGDIELCDGGTRVALLRWEKANPDEPNTLSIFSDLPVLQMPVVQSFSPGQGDHFEIAEQGGEVQVRRNGAVVARYQGSISAGTLTVWVQAAAAQDRFARLSVANIVVDGNAVTTPVEFIPTLDTIVRVYDRYGNLLGQDDDSGDGRNSKLLVPAGLNDALFVEVSGYGDRSIGSYVVTVKSVDAPAQMIVGLYDVPDAGAFDTVRWDHVAHELGGLEEQDRLHRLLSDGTPREPSSPTQDFNISIIRSRATITGGVAWDMSGDFGSSFNYGYAELSDGVTDPATQHAANSIRIGMNRYANESTNVLWVIGEGYTELENIARRETSTVTFSEKTPYTFQIVEEDNEIHVYVGSTRLARFAGTIKPGSHFEALTHAAMTNGRYAKVEINNLLVREATLPGPVPTRFDDFDDNLLDRAGRWQTAGDAEEKDGQLKLWMFRNGAIQNTTVWTAPNPTGTRLSGFQVNTDRTAGTVGSGEAEAWIGITNGTDYIHIRWLNDVNQLIVETGGVYGEAHPAARWDPDQPGNAETPDGPMAIRENGNNIEVLHNNTVKYTIYNRSVQPGSYFEAHARGQSSLSRTYSLSLDDLHFFQDPVLAAFAGVPALEADKDTGPSDADHITKNLTLSFSWVPGPAGTQYQYREGELLEDGTVTYGNWSVPQTQTSATIALAHASLHVFSVRPIDSQGVVGEESVRGFIVDTTVPSVPGQTRLTAESDPNGDGLIHDFTPTLRWDAADDDHGIAGYQWRINQGAWSVLQRDPTVTLDLAEEGMYRFEVHAVDLAGNEGPNTGMTFTVTSGPLMAPIPTGPSGIQATDIPTFSWNSVADAVHYDVWVNAIINGQETVGHPVLRNTNVTEVSWTPNTIQALLPGQTYRWYVGAVSHNGITFWSTGQSFTVVSIAPPIPIGPSGTVDTDRPTFAWTMVSGATQYDLWVNAVVNGQETVGSPVFRNANASETSLTLTATQALNPGRTYRWYIGAVSNNGTRFWSGGQTFTIASLPVATPTGPSGPITTDTPTFSWNAVANAVHYDVWVNPVINGQEVLNTPVLRNSNVTETSWTPSLTQALSPGHTYRWYIGAVSNTGTTIWNSGVMFAIAPLEAPIPSGPSGSVITDRPTFAWTTVSGATRYDVWVNGVFNGQETVGNPVLRNTNATGTSWTPSVDHALTPGQTYRWYIGAVSNNGTTVWSGGRTFTIAALPAPTPTGPAGTIATDTPTFTWNSVPTAAHYDVWINVVTNGQESVGQPVVRDANVGGTSWTTGLASGRTYKWYVGAVSTNGTTFWSSGTVIFVLP